MNKDIKNILYGLMYIVISIIVFGIGFFISAIGTNSLLQESIIEGIIILPIWVGIIIVSLLGLGFVYIVGYVSNDWEADI